jgi:hypothetical protein
MGKLGDNYAKTSSGKGLSDNYFKSRGVDPAAIDSYNARVSKVNTTNARIQTAQSASTGYQAQADSTFNRVVNSLPNVGDWSTPVKSMVQALSTVFVKAPVAAGKGLYGMFTEPSKKLGGFIGDAQSGNTYVRAVEQNNQTINTWRQIAVQNPNKKAQAIKEIATLIDSNSKLSEQAGGELKNQTDKQLAGLSVQIALDFGLPITSLLRNLGAKTVYSVATRLPEKVLQKGMIFGKAAPTLSKEVLGKQVTGKAAAIGEFTGTGAVYGGSQSARDEESIAKGAALGAAIGVGTLGLGYLAAKGLGKIKLSKETPKKLETEKLDDGPDLPELRPERFIEDAKTQATETNKVKSALLERFGELKPEEESVIKELSKRGKNADEITAEILKSKQFVKKAINQSDEAVAKVKTKSDYTKAQADVEKATQKVVDMEAAHLMATTFPKRYKYAKNWKKQFEAEFGMKPTKENVTRMAQQGLDKGDGTYQEIYETAVASGKALRRKAESEAKKPAANVKFESKPSAKTSEKSKPKVSEMSKVSDSKDSDVAEAITGWTSGSPKAFNESVVSTLKKKKIGVDELPYDKDGNVTLYRKGDVEPGKPQSYTTKQYDDSHKPYVVNKNDIVVNFNGKGATDFMEKNFQRGDRDTALSSFESWKKMEQEVVVMMETPKEKSIPPTTKPSGFAERIKVESIKRGMDDVLPESAGYTPKVREEQAKLSANVLNGDIDKAARIISGEDELPTGLNGPALAHAAEKYLIKAGNTEAATKIRNALVKSKFSTEISEAGSTLSMLSEGSGPMKIIRRIQKAREDVATKKTKSKNVSSAKKATKENVKKVLDKAKKVPTKETWSSFIKGIEC